LSFTARNQPPCADALTICPYCQCFAAWSPTHGYHSEVAALVPVGDNYLVRALIRRFHEAKRSNSPSVTIWGSGTPKREFLYVDDMAAASVFVMNLPKSVYDLAPGIRIP
jgi:GDP-L-fucose synthase